MDATIPTTKTDLWSDDFLWTARNRKDPLADDFVAELATSVNKIELYKIMQFLLDEFVWLDHDKIDEATRIYIERASKLPDWADGDLIKKGETFFAMHGPEISMMLLLKSLPATYCCWRGAEVVHASGRMTEHSGNLRPFTRRLMETAKFVINVMTVGGMEESTGIGIRAAVKVRTLHAFIRYFLNSAEWDVEKYGEPINQEDYAGTMLAFSVFVIEGMEAIGIKISKEEKEAYFHTWRVVASIIGVEDTLIAENYDEGEWLGHTIINQQKGPSESGQELTKACLDFMQSLVPFRVLRFLPNQLMKFLMGPELSEMANIKGRSNVFIRISFYFFRGLVRMIEWMKHHISFVGRLAVRINPKILDYFIRKFLKSAGTPFTPSIIQKEVKVISETP